MYVKKICLGPSNKLRGLTTSGVGQNSLNSQNLVVVAISEQK